MKLQQSVFEAERLLCKTMRTGGWEDSIIDHMRFLTDRTCQKMKGGSRIGNAQPDQQEQLRRQEDPVSKTRTKRILHRHSHMLNNIQAAEVDLSRMGNSWGLKPETQQE